MNRHPRRVRAAHHHRSSREHVKTRPCMQRAGAQLGAHRGYGWRWASSPGPVQPCKVFSAIASLHGNGRYLSPSFRSPQARHIHGRGTACWFRIFMLHTASTNAGLRRRPEGYHFCAAEGRTISLPSSSSAGIIALAARATGPSFLYTRHGLDFARQPLRHLHFARSSHSLCAVPVRV
jgi:hypothetical protein